MNKQRWFLWTCIVLVVAGCAVLVTVNRTAPDNEPDQSLVQQQQKTREVAKEREVPNNRQALAEALGLSEDQIDRIGDVDRPLRDMNFDNRIPEQEGVQSVADALPAGPQPGQAPRLSGNENPQVAGLVAEMRGNQESITEKADKRVVTSWFKPQAFDQDAYNAEPDAYLNQIHPARAFAPAQPGEGVTPLEPISGGFHSILQGEKVVLQVKADARQPVAFYTPQTGFFEENLLTSVTVQADENGIATATFKADKGSMGVVDILAASPVHSRQLQFRVKVDLPEPTGGN